MIDKYLLLTMQMSSASFTYTIFGQGFAAASYALLGLYIFFLMDRLSITFQEQLPKMLKSLKYFSCII
jgi:hypothetical protein